MNDHQDTRFGRLAVSKGLLSQDQVTACFDVIKSLPEDNRPRLGEVLVQKGLLKPGQVRALLAEQSKTIVHCSKCEARFNVKGFDPAKTYTCAKCGAPLVTDRDTQKIKVDESYVDRDEKTAARAAALASQMSSKTRTREAAVSSRKPGATDRRLASSPPEKPSLLQNKAVLIGGGVGLVAVLLAVVLMVSDGNKKKPASSSSGSASKPVAAASYDAAASPVRTDVPAESSPAAAPSRNDDPAPVADRPSEPDLPSPRPASSSKPSRAASQPASAPAESAGVLVLKNGTTLEAQKLIDNGATWQVVTRFGTLSVAKDEVAKIVKTVGEMTGDAEADRTKAKALYDQALKASTVDEKNRLLHDGVDLLGKAKEGYIKAREVFTGSQYESLDVEASKIVQEMRLFRDKMSSEGKIEAAKDPNAAKAAVAVDSGESKSTPASSGKSGGDSGKHAVAVEAGKSDGGDRKKIDAPKEPTDPTTDEEAVAWLDKPSAGARMSALKYLRNRAVPTALSKLIEIALKDPDAAVARAAAAAIPKSGDSKTVAKQLQDELADGTVELKTRAIRILQGYEDTVAADALLKLFKNGYQGGLRVPLTSAFKQCREKVIPKMLTDIGKYPPDLQSEALKILGVMRAVDGAKALIPTLGAADQYRDIAIHGLLMIGKPAVPLLIAGGLGNANNKVRMWSAYILRDREVTGQQFTAQKKNEWAGWWLANKKEIEYAYEEYWKDQAEKGYPVNASDFDDYNRNINYDLRWWIW